MQRFIMFMCLIKELSSFQVLVCVVTGAAFFVIIGPVSPENLDKCVL